MRNGFDKYAKKRDSEVLLENVGTNKNDIRQASKAMKEWIQATFNMLEAVEHVPEAFGAISGAVQTPNSLGERSIEHELALEVQRVRYVLQEANLADLMDRLNQHQARISAATQQLS